VARRAASVADPESRIRRMAWIVRAREGPVRVLGGSFFAVSSPGFCSCSMARIYPSGARDKTWKSKRDNRQMKRRKIEPEELLAAVAEAVDDGFLPASDLSSRFPKFGWRALRSARTARS
jgi:hypothetical protein